MRATSRTGAAHLPLDCCLARLLSAVASGVNPTSILCLLLSLVKLSLLSCEDLLLFAEDLRVVLILDGGRSLRGWRGLTLGRVTAGGRVDAGDVLGALSLTDAHLLALVVEAKLLRLA